MSLEQPAIVAEASKTITVAGAALATVGISDGRYQILNMNLTTASFRYAQKGTLGFRYKRSDQTLITFSLKDGWFLYGRNLIVEGTREVIGPGDFFGIGYLDAAGTITLNMTFRRLLP